MASSLTSGAHRLCSDCDIVNLMLFYLFVFLLQWTIRSLRDKAVSVHPGTKTMPSIGQEFSKHWAITRFLPANWLEG